MALSLAHQVVAERRPSRNRLCVAIAPLLVLVVTLTTARISHAVPARLTTEQRSEVRKLLSEFRRARKTPEKRDAIVEKLLKIGAPTPENLLKTIQKEIGPQLKK